MFKFDNPFDISKDGNAFVDGIRFHIRESAENVEKIMNFINKYVNITYETKPLDVLEFAMKELKILDSELTIVDEHYLLDWIRAQSRD